MIVMGKADSDIIQKTYPIDKQTLFSSYFPFTRVVTSNLGKTRVENLYHTAELENWLYKTRVLKILHKGKTLHQSGRSNTQLYIVITAQEKKNKRKLELLETLTNTPH